MLEEKVVREINFAMEEINDFDKQVKSLFTDNKDDNLSPSRQKKRESLIEVSENLYDAIEYDECWMTEESMSDLINVSRRQIQRAKSYLRLTGRIDIILDRNGKRENFAHRIIKLDRNEWYRGESWPEIRWKLFDEFSPQYIDSLPIQEQLDIYEEMNLPFIPLRHVVFDHRGRPYCSCRHGYDCEDKGKHPIVRYSELDFSKRSTYREMKRYWVNQNDTARDVCDVRNNIGFLTEAFSVIDIDPRNNGNRSLAILEEMYGDIPKEMWIRTGGSGHHFYVSNCLKQNINLLGFKGIDVKGRGNYIVAPGSIHRSGQYYRWHNVGRPGLLSDDLLYAIEDRDRELIKCQKRSLAGNEESIAKKVLSGKLHIPEGQRSGTIFKIACSFRSSGLEYEEIWRKLSKVNQNQCKPPLPEYKVKDAAKQAAKYPSGRARGQDMGLMP